MANDTSLTLYSHPSSIRSHEEVIKLLESNDRAGIPAISEDFLAEILNHFETHHFETQGIPLPFSLGRHKYKWVFHMSKLRTLDMKVRCSKKFNMEAVIRIFSKHLEFMIKQGFEVNAELLHQDKTPLGSAALNRCPALIGALIRVGANVNYGSYSVYADGRVSSSSPLKGLHFNSLEKRSEEGQELIDQCIEILTANGCDPNAHVQDPIYVNQRLTPLWYAAHFGETGTVRSLVKAKADIDFETNHIFGDSTALQASVYEPHFANLATTKALVELGADLFIKNKEGKTAADIAKDKKLSTIACFLDKAMVDFIAETRVSFLAYDIPSVLINIIGEYLNFNEEPTRK